MTRKRRRKKKKDFSRTLVPLLITFLGIFTVVMVIGFFVTRTEPSTLIMSVYGACTGELLAMAAIKTTKTKYPQEEEENDETRSF